MPSYRVRLTVGLLRPGVAPERLLPESAAAAGETTTVEAKDVAVVAGRPQITVRFTAADDGEAQLVAARVHETARGLAQVSGPALTQRVGGRWRDV
jgi:selenophosphate synthetase-related protein